MLEQSSTFQQPGINNKFIVNNGFIIIGIFPKAAKSDLTLATASQGRKCNQAF